MDKEDREIERRLEVYPPIHKLGSFGKWLRRKLLNGILGGSSVLVGMQGLRSPLLNVVMNGVSFLGEEEFYTLLITVVMWVCEARLGRLLALLMALAFYCTGFLKNLLCLPRPPVPPVVPLQRCQDWSLPSHHALLSVNMPWYIWLYLSRHYPQQAALSQQLGMGLFLTIALWSFLVMFSRMYLGVHSPADILSGGIIGCLLLAGWMQVDLTIDYFLSNSGGGAILVFASVAMVMLYLHPDPSPTTFIYDETVALMGVAGGVVISQALGPANIMVALLERNKAIDSVWECVMYALLRFVSGLVIVLLMRILAKTLAREILMQLCKLLSIPSVCVKTVSQVTHRKVHYSKHFITLDKPLLEQVSGQAFRWSAKRPLNLHIAVRLATYTGMGLGAVLLAPAAFMLAGI